MAKAHLTTKSGTVITIEGTRDEVAQLISQFDDSPRSRRRVKINRNKTRAKKGGPNALIAELVGEDFFKKPKELSAIKTALEERGHYYPRTKLLQADGEPQRQAKAVKISQAAPAKVGALDFTMPIRPFVKKYAVGMNGAQKFTLLLAFLTKGDTSKTVALSDIEAQWNKMTGKGLLGIRFNRFHPAQARDNDWASTKKAGAYRLRPSWKAILSG